MTHTSVLSQFASIFISLLAGLSIIVIRLRASNKPTSLKKIMIPPFGMATGFLMFAVPAMRISWSWGVVAFLAGAVLFSYPLIRTSRFEIINGKVYLRRSKTFVFIIFALLLFRLLLHDVVEHYVSIPQTGAIFFILAFGMILPWRLAMLREYLKLKDS